MTASGSGQLKAALITFAALAVGAVGAVGVQPLVAQGRGPDPQGQLLRDAAVLETRGDLDGAELALRSLLETDPTSVGGLFALERVLRAKGEVAELLPLVDTFLEREADSEMRGLKLRLLADIDSLDALVAEGERWIAEHPDEGATYRLVAQAYEPALGADRAIDVLRRGRSALGDQALALEVGDVLAAAGDIDGAVDEWARAVGSDGSEAQTVRRRVQQVTGQGLEPGRRLVVILGESDEPLQRGAAARIALELRLLPESLELSERYASSLQGRARESFLEDVGRIAADDELGLATVATWAYEELRRGAASPDQRRRFDVRIVNTALEAGDTATALAAQRRVADSYSRESEEGRQAAAQVIRLEATAAEPDELRTSWADFRTDFPDAPELDGLAAWIAAKLQARGDSDGAAAVLEGINGPRSALESAYLLLDAGDLEGGRGTLLLAVSGLPPSEATPVIQLAGLLGRVSDASAVALVAAGVDAHRGRGVEAARVLAEETRDLAAGDRAPLLAEAARIADRGGASELAVEIRERILAEHPDASEVEEASLGLARHHAAPGGDATEAVRLLEELITQRPNAAVVPEARLELERLRSRGS